jgi:hypothetical protein
MAKTLHGVVAGGVQQDDAKARMMWWRGEHTYLVSGIGIRERRGAFGRLDESWLASVQQISVRLDACMPLRFCIN